MQALNASNAVPNKLTLCWARSVPPAVAGGCDSAHAPTRYRGWYWPSPSWTMTA